MNTKEWFTTYRPLEWSFPMSFVGVAILLKIYMISIATGLFIFRELGFNDSDPELFLSIFKMVLYVCFAEVVVILMHYLAPMGYNVVVWVKKRLEK